MGAHILVIDDSESLCSILKLTLEFNGHHVLTANDGLEALEKTRLAKFNLIFCDIDMPVMNGLEFVRRYRAEIDKTTPIIMLTAEGSELISLALAAGATTALCKPFEPLQLLKGIEQFLP